MNIAIIGYGYVGNALGVLARSKGHSVIPVDIASPWDKVPTADVVVFCLPTPTEGDKPNYRMLEDGMQQAQQVGLDRDALVIIESTVGIGFTGNVAANYFPLNDIAYSPERVDPGTHRQFPDKICKLVSGLTRKARQRAEDFYQALGIEIYRCESTAVAEASKLMENTFRAVNIAFVNEMWRICVAKGVDIHAVIRAATTKGFGFMPFQPGPGVGGHCIPEDPYYLQPRRGGVIQAALWMNETQPEWVVKQANKRLNGGVKDRRILLIGGTYKANVKDRRNAPSAEVRHLLYFDGAKVVDTFDPHMIGGTGQMADLTEYDLIIVLVAHDNVDLTALHNHKAKVLDCTGTLS